MLNEYYWLALSGALNRMNFLLAGDNLKMDNSLILPAPAALWLRIPSRSLPYWPTADG